MKALLVLMGMDIGGAETHVLELALGLKEKGVNVLVASNGGVYTKELEENSIPHFKAPLNTKNPIKMLKSLFFLAKIIKEQKPDVVHGHARIPSFLLGILSKFMKFNFVTTAHWVFNVNPALKILSNWGYRTIAVSNDIKKYLTENYGTYPQDISVTINGIPDKKFSIPRDESLIEELGLSSDKRKILSVSRLDTDRSLLAHQLIEIAPKLCEKEDIEIIIVGGGDDYENILEKAEKVNSQLGKKVIFMTDARTDINRFVSISDFVVAVSRSALEAMCGRKPVIVAGNEGYLGIFEPLKLDNAIATNFCCRGMGDSTPELLFKDLEILLSASSDEVKALGDFGAETILQKYSVERMVSDNLRVYEEIINHGNKYKDFVISGYYGHKNSGDDALLYAVINDLKEQMPFVRVTVLSANPKETTALHGVHAINRFNFFKVTKAIKNSGCLISGGGSLLQDVTSTKSLIYYTSLINYAKKLGKKVYIYANGIGPLTKPKNISSAKKALENADLITLRDKKSADLLKSLKLKNKNIVLTADPALNLVPSKSAKAIFGQEKLPKGEYVAISIRNWKNDENLMSSMAECADKLAEKYGLIPVFVPMQPTEDAEICLKTISKMKNTAYCIKGHYEYNDLMAFCKKCKLVIGMRLHILLYASSVSVPSIGIIYDPKILGCIKMLGQEKYLIDLEKLTGKALINRCDKIFKNYDEVKTSLTKTIKMAKKSAKQNGLLAKELYQKGE